MLRIDYIMNQMLKDVKNSSLILASSKKSETVNDSKLTWLLSLVFI